MRYFVLVLCLLAACEPRADATPFAVTRSIVTVAQEEVLPANTLVPTAHPVASRTATLPPTPTVTPSLTPSRTLTASPIPTSTPIASPTRGTPPGAGTVIPTWTPPPLDPSVTSADHLWFGRPIGVNGVDIVARTYPYGGTNGGRLQVHHGVDIVNPLGTPILAAGDGTVYYAGDDLTLLFGSMNDYYGNLVVIQHDDRAADGLPVFTLYGHMSRVQAQIGQPVHEGDVIGYVGATGVALGPHVHFEVRVGDPQAFGATRNPELWMRPLPRRGTLVGRVTDAAGSPIAAATIRVESADNTFYSYSYADASVNADPVFRENFTVGDLPANYYTVSVVANGRAGFRRLIYVYPDRTTWLDVQLP